MPFTPYHFGLSALPGLLTRGRVDITIPIAVNILIDTEVLADSFFAPGWPVHQLWHFHTLLIGGLVGAAMGTVVYAIKPLRRGCQRINRQLGFSYSPTLLSMTLSGTIGAAMHVLLDSLYHYDVQVFWPIQDNLLLRWACGEKWFRMDAIQHGVLRGCAIGWVLAGLLTAVFLFKATQTHKKR
jgi:hypothetical protein